MLKVVKCPEPFTPLFEKAEEIMTPQFKRINRNPETGTIEISSERYVMYRGSSMAIGLYLFGILSDQQKNDTYFQF